ncbi:hypothetical protein M9Y10_004294 [Tritrichomonas musculus]|uniref:Surface antigen BspA-like n=1 Tax=Tritrichomonas musculus TaxID=1915356 RepID=A0ABR2JS00_9EUKA
MLYFLIYSCFSYFIPNNKPYCLTNNKCSESIDPILTSIEKNQYCGCKYPSSKVILDKTIQRIPSYSFFGATILELKLHSNIHSIDEGAFANCSIILNLTEATHLKSIGNGAFYMSKIEEIIFPRKVKMIGSYSFANITMLKHAIIRSKVIKSYAFLGCYSMICEEIEISGSGCIQDHAFHDCYKLNGTLIIHEANEKRKNDQIIYSTIGNSSFQNSGIVSLKIAPLSIIGSNCFNNCSSLSYASIINAENIEKFAFKNAVNLQIDSIIAKFINKKAFQNCYNLNPKIHLKEGGKIDESSFKNCIKVNKSIINKTKNMLQISTESGSCGKNVYFEIKYRKINTSLILTISGKGKMYNFESYSMPWHMDRKRIEEINIIDKVTTIGDYSFYEFKELTSININSKIESIGYGAFEECIKLRSIVLPNSVLSISGGAFYNCQTINSINIPKGITSIGVLAFYNCMKLTDISLPRTVKSIGEKAFQKCSRIRSISIPKGITSIKSQMFYDCIGLHFIDLPNTIVTIEREAFWNCYMLESIVFPDSVKKVEYYILYNCNSLSKVSIGSSLNDFDCDDFNGWCHTYFSVSPKNKYYLSYQGSLYSKERTYLIKYYHSHSNSNPKLLSNTTGIKRYAFLNCQMINIVIPNEVTFIGRDAFKSCYSLESIEIPDKVDYIYSDAFLNCESLRYVYIGSSVTNIYHPNFNNKGLIYFNVSEKNTVYESYQGSLYLKNPSTLFKYYVNSNNDLKKGVSSISDYAFSECNLKQINIPNSVTSIGNWSFLNCPNLKSIEIHKNIQFLGNDAFLNCNSLESVYIDSSIYFDHRMFNNKCLTKFSILNEDSPYLSYQGSLYLKNPLTLLKYCANSKEDFKSGVVSFGSESFYSSSKTSMTFPDTVTSIESDAFLKCKELKHVNLNNVEFIGSKSFQFCVKLSFILITSKVNYIEESAFENTNLSLVYIFSSNLTIEKLAFNSLCSLCEVYYMGMNYSDDEKYQIAIFNQAKINVPYEYNSKRFYVYPVTHCLLFGDCGNESKWIFNTNTETMILYGAGHMTNYQTIYETPWKNIRHIIKEVIVIDNLASIGVNAFSHCDNLKSITTYKPIGSIESNAFSECQLLALLDIQDSIVKIDEYSFKNSAISVIKYNGTIIPSCSTDAFSNKKTGSIDIFVNKNYDDQILCGLNISDYIDGNKPIEINYPDKKKFSDTYNFIYISPNDWNNSELLDKNLLYHIGSSLNNRINVVYSHNFTFKTFLSKIQYIHPIDNSTIYFESGNLNLDMEKTDNVTIFADDETLLNVSIKGSGQLFIKHLKDKFKTIRFDKNVEIQNQLNLVFPDYVDSVLINSIIFDINSSINLNTERQNKVVDLFANQVVSSIGLNATISNITILESLTIYQKGKIKLENVTFDDAILKYVIYDYDVPSDSLNPFIGNAFSSVPKSFIIKDKRKNGIITPKNGKDYILMSGFENIQDCNQWLNIIQLNESNFNTKYCDNYNNVVIKNDSFKKKKKSKLNKNDKIGIIVGCLSGAIVIVSCIVNLHCFMRIPVENDSP